MPRRAKGPRLYLDPKRQQWVIRDRSRFIRTGCGERDGTKAEKFLADYLAAKHEPDLSSNDPLIADVLNVYATEIALNKKTARNIGYNIGCLLPWWGGKTVSEISTKSCREYAATKKSQAAGAHIKVLKSAVGYWNAEYGPLTVTPVFWKPASNEPRDRWLTRSEAARLLRAARPYQHLRRIIVLCLYTGSRPGVVMALRWNQIDMVGKTLSRLPIGATQDKRKRAPKVRIGRRLLTHLKRWKRLDGPHADVVCHYDGRAVSEPHTAWAKVIKTADLDGITLHMLRHTRATWLMQAGVPIWEAAGFLGMSTKTLERVYGHHAPDHQEQAANTR